MNQSYSYDELYGTLIHKNKEDTERTYFIIECLKCKFRRWMFVEGWNKVSEKSCERDGLTGFEITLKKGRK